MRDVGSLEPCALENLRSLGSQSLLAHLVDSHWVTTGHLITATAASRVKNMQAEGATTIVILASNGSPRINKSDSLQDAS
jgi:hypothetical protein